MNSVSKTSSIQAYTMLLVKKAVHPEFFGIESRRRVEHGEFDVEAWIFRGGHVIRFQQRTVDRAAGAGAGARRLDGRRPEGAVGLDATHGTRSRMRPGTGATSPSNSSSSGTSPKLGASAGAIGEGANGMGAASPSAGVMPGVMPGRGPSNGSSGAGTNGSGTGSGPAGGAGQGSRDSSAPSMQETGPASGGALPCLCEIVSDQPDQIPDRGLLSSFPCAGERDHEERISPNLMYMTTIQTETLSEHLYVGTYKEMMQHGRESNSLVSAWTDELGRPNLSLVDLQRLPNEVHVQAYHLRSDCGLVLRTQSMVQFDPRAGR